LRDPLGGLEIGRAVEEARSQAEHRPDEARQVLETRQEATEVDLAKDLAGGRGSVHLGEAVAG
jgi:hypothetical protein